MEENKKSNKIYIVIIIILLAIIACFVYYTIQNESETSFINLEKNVDSQDVISISNLDEYVDFINNCNLYNNYENVTINLKADIDFEGSEENPTPTFKNDFKGTFNGNGYSFNNVYIEEDSYNGAALFATNSGTIKKLTITGSVKSSYSAAGFVGKNYGTIMQCINYADIEGAYQVGGICAWSGDTDVSGNILYCINHGSIVDVSPGSGGTIGFGGILGYCYKGNVSYCFSTGNIPLEGYHSSCTSNISGWFFKDDSHETKNCFYLTSNEVNKDSEYFNPTTSLSSDTVMKFLNQDVKAFELDKESEYPTLNMKVNIK